MTSSMEIGQLIFTVVVGGSLICLVYSLAKRGLISFRYLVGWLLLGTLVVTSVPVAFGVRPLSAALAMNQGTLLSIIGIILVVAICIQLSISISGVYERLRRTSEEVAHLKNAIEKLNKQKWTI